MFNFFKHILELFSNIFHAPYIANLGRPRHVGQRVLIASAFESVCNIFRHSGFNQILFLSFGTIIAEPDWFQFHELNLLSLKPNNWFLTGFVISEQQLRAILNPVLTILDHL